MSALSVIDRCSHVASLSDVSELKDRLRECMALTAESIVEMAAIVHRLDSLGEDLSEFPAALMRQLRLVAAKRLLPEAVVRFAGQARLLDMTATMPVDQQQRIINGERVPVFYLDGDHRLLALSEMTAAERSQVIGVGGVRTKVEQLAWLREKAERERQRKARAVTSTNGVVVDRKRVGIVVGDRFISAGELATYLAQLTKSPS